MADLNVQLILRLVDRATGPARRAAQAIERIGGAGAMRNAQRMTRGADLMAQGLRGTTGTALKAGAAVAAYHGAVAAAGLAFIRPAAQMERFKVQLTNLEGSSAGAEKAMAWISEFATRTPLELDETISAYAKLKAFGLDPTQGSLQAMVDTMAATGGGAEQLDGLVLALGQAWTKGKLQGEEALQMLERGVPVWDLLAQKLGKTSAEVQDMATKGKLGREEIQLLIDALGQRNAGAADGMSKTWDGIISNLMDHWSRWQVMVMDAGVFDYFKGKLQAVLDFLNAAAADGRLQDWAEMTAAYILATFAAIERLAAGAIELWGQVYPSLALAAEWMGGWQNLLIAIAGLGFAKTVIGTVVAIGKLTSGLAFATRGAAGLLRVLVRVMLYGIGKATVTVIMTAVRALTLLGTATIAVARGALVALAGGARLAMRALMLLGRAVFMNPLTAALAAVAGLVYVIYDNWDDIVGYFQGKVDRVRAAFQDGLLDGVLATLAEFDPFVLMRDAAEGLFRYITGWSFDDVATTIMAAFDIDLIAAGMAMMQSMWDGIKARFAAVLDWFRTLPSQIVTAIGQIDLASLIHWPEPPAWLSRLWSGDPDPAPTTAARGDSLGYGQAVTPIAGARALGGPVRAGQVYRWMEQGEERFVPRTDGHVVSNRSLRAATRPASRSVTLHVGGITINAAPGMDAAAVGRSVRRELQAIARRGRLALDDRVDHG